MIARDRVLAVKDRRFKAFKEEAMGLRERQRVRELQQEVLPRTAAALKDLSGGEIAVEIDVDSFAENMDALWGIEGRGLAAIESVVRALCYNDYGKDAVREGLKQVIFVNIADSTNKGVHFAEGLLRIRGAYAEDWGYPKEEQIQRVLEDDL